MLVVSREVGERIFIGESIIVTLVNINGNQCQVGVEAPRHVPVYREELLLPDGTLPPSRAGRPPVPSDPDFAPDPGGEG